MVYTDHAPLKASLTGKYSSGRRAHWSETIAEFDIEICYKLGRKNNDAVSRAPVDMEDDNSDGYITAITDNSTDNVPMQDTHTVIDQDHDRHAE